MTRARALWLGAALLVLAAAGYLLRRRSRRPKPAPAVAPARPPATAPPTPHVEPVAATTEESAISEPSPEQIAPAPTATAVDEAEQPLPMWVRVAIVAAALLAFFAISLLATKHV